MREDALMTLRQIIRKKCALTHKVRNHVQKIPLEWIERASYVVLSPARQGYGVGVERQFAITESRLFVVYGFHNST